jgi:hypothetical protein
MTYALIYTHTQIKRPVQVGGFVLIQHTIQLLFFFEKDLNYSVASI